MTDTTYKTAIYRNRPSKPAQWLVAHSIVQCGPNTLDYGCGRGADAKAFGWDKYDPHFAPEMPLKNYPFIVCIYVLNVLPPIKRRDVLRNVANLLIPGGHAYFVVRRDHNLKKLAKHSTNQYYVELDLPIVRNDPTYCVYELIRGH